MAKNNNFGGNLIWRMARNDNFGGNLIWRMAKNVNFGGNLIWRIFNEIAKSAEITARQNFFEELVLNVASLTKGGSGPSGMDAEGWRRIICSSVFGTTNLDLRKALAEMIKKLCIDDLSRDTENATSIEEFTACRMIPLDKNPGLRPIGVGEVLDESLEKQ